MACRRIGCHLRQASTARGHGMGEHKRRVDTRSHTKSEAGWRARVQKWVPVAEAVGSSMVFYCGHGYEEGQCPECPPLPPSLDDGIA